MEEKRQVAEAGEIWKIGQFLESEFFYKNYTHNKRLGNTLFYTHEIKKISKKNYLKLLSKMDTFFRKITGPVSISLKKSCFILRSQGCRIGVYFLIALKFGRCLSSMAAGPNLQAIWRFLLQNHKNAFTTFEIQTWLPDFILGLNPFRTFYAWPRGAEVARYLGNDTVISSLSTDRQLNFRAAAWPKLP